MIRIFKISLFSFILLLYSIDVLAADSTRYPALHPYIRYTGRFRALGDGEQVWASGANALLRFKGTYCVVEIEDENKWGKWNNYLQVIVDGKESKRIQTQGTRNRIILADGLEYGEHEIIVVKDTESLIGYIRFQSWICNELVPPGPLPARRIEFIGNSITCGMGADQSAKKCGEAEWFDQHNAWNAYGPITARNLKASWHLSSESGIGLIHSCCNKPYVMPEIFDKMNFGDNQFSWSFTRFQPDLISICLGQNDGIQDSAAFCRAYLHFIETLKGYYPKSAFLLLSSPMADSSLRTAQKGYLSAIQHAAVRAGIRKISVLIFDKSYNSGCTYHPSLNEHREIAEKLTAHISKWMNW